MPNFFEFEADFVDSLRCIPMQVRQKLDTSGIKLKLSDWSHLTKLERETLVELPCSTEAEIQSYRKYLHNLILERTGTPAAELLIEPNPAWLDAKNVPTNLQEKAREFGVMLSSQQWAELTPLQRFALIKLSRPSHENQNFPKALKEFHLF
ncbi:nitrate reductase associated protein [Brasilonema sp. UFV-L1]|uniref:nitrate reductase associated protein n=1 Tax=Brasilonema sp. UFV-L1 TaxID=2234130 RepID=UPI00145CD1D0|nr:nitrate reductase associated protein [Brasilonema sp. UFV-L1]NMG10223.1 nitrate reductase associated protein [Brasilonema sp. UFV-L1]